MDCSPTYQRVVDASADDSLGKLSRLIEPNTCVLELGPAYGYFTQYLVEQRQCVVDCVECSAEMAPHAARFARTMWVADLDQIDLAERFTEQSYDYVIAADVLEHLRDPWRVVRACRPLLKPSGRLLVSIPNVGHAALVAELTNGKFEYRKEGLLDGTHLRFFTRSSFLALLRQAGFRVEGLDRVSQMPEHTEFCRTLEELPPALRSQLLRHPDALTYQFIAVAAVGEMSPEEWDRWSEPTGAATPYFCAQLFWTDREEAFTEQRSVRLYPPLDADRRVLRFELPAGSNVRKLRFDPADRPAFFHLSALRLLGHEPDNHRSTVIWELSGGAEIAAQCQMEGVQFLVSSGGATFLSRSNDPQMIFSLEPGQTLAPGSRLVVEVEMDWPQSPDYMIASAKLDQAVAKWTAAVDDLEKAKRRFKDELADSKQLVNEQARELAELRKTRELLTEAEAVLRDQLRSAESAAQSSDAMLAAIYRTRGWRMLEKMRRLLRKMHVRPWHDVTTPRSRPLAAKERTSQLETTLARQEDLSSGRQDRIAEHDLAAAHETTGRLQGRLDEVQAEIVTLQSTLSTIYGSKGWRALTAYRAVKYGVIQQGRRAAQMARKCGRGACFLLTDPRGFRVRWRRWRGTQGDAYAGWLAKYHPAPDREDVRRRIRALTYQPKISIVMPTHDPAEAHLRAAIESVRGQLYVNWELCIADDASTKPHVRSVLQDYAVRDDRIHVRLLDKNLGIAGASNAALSLATGEFIGLLDHDDVLTPNAVLEVVKLLNTYPDTDMVYSDEDKLSPTGERCDPFFKPQWSPTTFLSYMYTCHFGVYRKSTIDRIGGFRAGFEGSQDYDLVLRLTEQTSRVRHIPTVLYHWRMSERSTASDPANKSYAEDAARRALTEAMQRRGLDVDRVEIGVVPTTYRIRYRIGAGSLVDIIIPTRNNRRYLEQCVRSIREKSTYQHYRINIIDNGSDAPDTLKYLEDVAKCERTRVLRYGWPFNYSAINNWACSRMDGPYLLLLNDDTEVITPSWLEAMVEQAQQPTVGAVGVKLLYPDGRIQHGGVILGIGGVAGHAHKYYPAAHPGYFSRLVVIQNVSAVTGACLMIRREVWEQLGGLNETELAVAFNDVDLCLRMREVGYQLIYTPFATLYHHESVSRGFAMNAAEIEYMKRTWNAHLLSDPFYNPNLTLTREDFSLWP